MKNSVFVEAVNCIMDSESVGYSFVKAFIDVLWENKKTLNINNYVLLWNVVYTPNTTPQVFVSFSNDQEFDISSLNTKQMMGEEKPFDSKRDSFKSLFLTETFKTSHIVGIPINGFTNENCFFETRGLILLFSQQSEIKINQSELNSFYYLLNKRKPYVLNCDLVCNALNALAISDSESPSKYTECFHNIGIALDEISNKYSECAKLYGLRHFSLWNFIHANINIKSKSFSRNTYKDVAHSCTNTLIFDEDSHFINEAVLHYKNKNEVQILKCLSLNEGEKSFKDTKFFEENELTNKNTTIIVVADGDSDLNFDFPDRILNFYISDIVYTPFISVSFLKIFTKNITNTIRKSLISCRNKMLTEFMEASMNSNAEMDFYDKATAIIKDANEAEDVLIYLKNEAKFELKKQNNDSTQNVGGLAIPDKYISDQLFIQWFTENVRMKETVFYVNNNSKAIVKSAVYMQKINGKTGRGCIVVLINRQHAPSTSCVYYNNIFDKDNYYITAQSGIFLMQYQTMQDSIKSKNYLLHKLRHEIPSCTESIDKGLIDIKNALAPGDKHMLNIVGNLVLNNSRVLLLAKFFSTVDFDIQQFAQQKIRINIVSFLNSYIEIFRTEGRFKGVDVYFNLKAEQDVYVNASNYFQLALVNVITNAVRYAASGTCVYIDVFEHHIVIRDLGIGIEDSEKDLIFTEGYRGNEAKKVNEKGMGYGLYLTRKVLSAHNFEIGVESILQYNKNYFAESAVLIYLNTLNVNDRKKFILNGINELDIHNAMKCLEEVKKSRDIIEIGKGYANLKLDTIKYWISYLSDNNVVFYDMDEQLFQNKLYEVVFTINI